MKNRIFLSVLTLIFSISTIFSQKGIDINNMNTQVRSQDDFYNYVNGGWMKIAVIPNDRSRWGSFDELREKTDLKALEILKKSMTENQPNGSESQKIKDIYASIMDLNTRNAKGISPLNPYLNKINAIKNLQDLQKYLIDVTPEGGNPFYSFYINAHMKNSNKNAIYFGGADLGMGRDYYQKEDEKSKQSLADYTIYVNQVKSKLGLKNTNINKSNIVDFEKNIGKTFLSVEEIRNDLLQYNPYAIKDLKTIVKNIDLEKYLNACGVRSDSVIITELKYFKAIDTFLTKKNIPLIKEFLKYNLLNSSAALLSEDLDNMKFDFYRKKLRGQKEQKALDKRALQTINGSVGEILGKLYVKETFPPEAKEKAKEMIDYLKKSFKIHIQNLTWMSEETKIKALEKLSTFTVKIGYPDKWKDYSKLNIKSNSEGGSYFSNMVEIAKWNFNDDLSKLNKPVDKTEWGMSPQTVNAYYNPPYNEIVFPAAILQAPFYDYKADIAVNFGGIGAVIGHEISHGFDDSGSLYDAVGNLNNWWTEQDKINFEKATQALADQYSAYEPLPKVKVNGKFTLGENIADLGGVSVSFDALQMYLKDKGAIASIDGFTQEQRFFLSWATIWRTKSTDQAITNQVKTDPHSPGYFRAIGPLENIKAFYEAFNIQKGDKMYKEPKNRIIIW